jgi:hypothetical protein
MSEAEDYRVALELCRRMAQKTSNTLEKTTWLDMAEAWRLLIICRSTDGDFNPAGQGVDMAFSGILSRHPQIARTQPGRYRLAYCAIHQVARRGASRLWALLKISRRPHFRLASIFHFR